MADKILVVSVHPDDETLGCGGTLLKHKKAGDEIFWLIITHIPENAGWKQSRINSRKKEIEAAGSLYGFSKIENLQFPTTRLHEVPFTLLLEKISNTIIEIEPDVIYLHNRSDIHSDHRIAFDAVISCTKHFRFPFIKKMLMFECLSETEFAPPLVENVFIPNVFVDISDFIDKKLEIMQIYESEVMTDNKPRSLSAIKSLAGYRGSRISVPYAEAFSLLFEKR
jgi:N-acetylglucosamine malate deacetylase 1